MEELTTVLEATLSPDTQAIQVAQQQLEQYASDLPTFLSSLAAVLADVSKSQVARMAAGLQLKNCLTSKDQDVRQAYQQRWLTIELPVRQHIKGLVLATLGTEQQQHRAAAQCIAYIAAVELQVNQWPELIPALLANVTSPQSTEQLKEASLEAIGYICEDLDPKFLANQANEILTAVVQGMRKEEPSNNVRLAATKALLNSLEFTKANFEKEVERHFIMQVVCEATQCNHVPIQVAALQNLVKIMSLYYVFMEAYMGPALFAITLEAIKNDTDEVALQGIEFWSTVCDEEADLAIEAAEAAESGHPPEQTSRFYVKGAMGYLVPLLLSTLTKQEEFDDEDDWNPCKAAGVCLSLMSGCCEDTIVPVVMPFVLENITSKDWKCRDAAIMALGSIMEGPEPETLSKEVPALVEPLIRLMEDEMVQVRDSAAWTIGRVCERCPTAFLNENYILPLLQVLVNGLSTEPRVAINVCWAISSLAEAAYDIATEAAEGGEDDSPDNFHLSPHFEAIVSKLLETTERADANSNNLRSSAYEALMDMIKYSAKDCYPVVLQTFSLIMERLNRLLKINFQVAGADRQQLMDIESLLCATLQSLLQKLTNADIVASSDNVMEAMLFILQDQQSGGVQEDALMTVGVLTNALGASFIKYMDLFMKVLVPSMNNVADVQVCLAGIGLVGDLCRTLSTGIVPYCDGIMTSLAAVLSNVNAHRSVKPPILTALGDIALAIGTNFSKYSAGAFQILEQATKFVVEKDNYDMIDYGNDLRDGCLEAYTGIIQGFKDSSENLSTLSGHVPLILDYITRVADDEDKSESNLSNAIGLLGDLCTAFGPLLANAGLLIQPQVLDKLNKLLTEGRRSRVKRTKTLTLWANKELKQLQQQPSTK